MRAAKLAIAIAVALIAAAAARAEDRFEKPFSRSLTYRGGRVTVENRFGTLNVRAGSGNTVTVRATIRSSDAEIGRRINIETSDGAARIPIRTVVPTISHHGSLSFSIDVDAVVPAEAPLLLSNHFGRIDATGLRAPSELVNRQGSIALHDSSGNQRLENSFGSITIDRAAGNVDAKNTNGSNTATRIDGKLPDSNRISFAQPTGRLTALVLRQDTGRR